MKKNFILFFLLVSAIFINFDFCCFAADSLSNEQKIINIQNYLIEYDKIPKTNDFETALLVGLFIPGASYMYNDNLWGLVPFFMSAGCYTFSIFSSTSSATSSRVFDVGLGIQIFSAVFGANQIDTYNRKIQKQRDALKKKYFGRKTITYNIGPAINNNGIGLSVILNF